MGRSGGSARRRSARAACAARAEQELRAGRKASRLLLGKLIDSFEMTYLPQVAESAALCKQQLAAAPRGLMEGPGRVVDRCSTLTSPES